MFGFTAIGYVCTMNVADVAPGWMMTLGGTAAICGLLLRKVTVAVPEPAWTSVTTPVACPPPITLVGVSPTLLIWNT